MELKITGIRAEADDVKTFELAPLSGEPLAYRAGQFLTFIHRAFGQEQRRSYSLSGAPGLGRSAAITVKRIPNGLMSRWLIDRACVGDVLNCEGGATGVFTLPEDLDPYEAVWLFAAGIGITPIFALLEELLHRHKKPVVLLYSNHSAERTVFQKELKHLEKVFAETLTVVWIWSDARDLRLARLSKESFPLFLRDHLRTAPARALCYICGPTSYMWLLQLLLQDAGVPPEQVRREVFVVDKQVAKRLPADKGPHKVTVYKAGQPHTFVNVYPESVLASAKAAGISLPYSCESGQCGSCTAICSSGKVWMSYNEVLTDKDLAVGRVLTCTGHAVGGDVVLVL